MVGTEWKATLSQRQLSAKRRELSVLLFNVISMLLPIQGFFRRRIGHFHFQTDNASLFEGGGYEAFYVRVGKQCACKIIGRTYSYVFVEFMSCRNEGKFIFFIIIRCNKRRLFPAVLRILRYLTAFL